MKFYEGLSKYYDIIFPKGDAQVKFLNQIVGDESKKVIDIACGNGVYAIELAKKGHEVLAIDLSLGMIQKAYELAKKEEKDLYLHLKACAMLELDEIITREYDVAFCIGNSLVHLHSVQEVQDFMSQVYNALDKQGKLIIQIINYDRILDQEVSELPIIESKENAVTFKRNYIVNDLKDKVEFKTQLIVGEKSYDNSVTLLALRQHELVEIMKLAGFNITGVYGSFKEEEYNPQKSFYTIVVGEK